MIFLVTHGVEEVQHNSTANIIYYSVSFEISSYLKLPIITASAKNRKLKYDATERKLKILAENRILKFQGEKRELTFKPKNRVLTYE